MAITVYKQKAIQNSWKSEIFSEKISEKNFFFWIFFSKSWNEGEFTNLRPETESGNRGDHELAHFEGVALCLFKNMIIQVQFWHKI